MSPYTSNKPKSCIVVVAFNFYILNHAFLTDKWFDNLVGQQEWHLAAESLLQYFHIDSTGTGLTIK